MSSQYLAFVTSAQVLIVGFGCRLRYISEVQTQSSVPSALMGPSISSWRYSPQVVASKVDAAPQVRLSSANRLHTLAPTAVIAVVPSVIKVLCYPHNIGSDDAYIHLRIATNVVRGLTWGINPHQPVNLSTSPAFTLLLAAAKATTQHAIGVTQVLSAAAVFGGLLLIFAVVFSETESVPAALFAEISAAFSVNLWRWNGTLMETTFAFGTVALTLWMFRRKARRTLPYLFTAGMVLGLDVLLRPEMGLLALLCLITLMMRCRPADWVRKLAPLVAGSAVLVLPWCLFANRHLGSIVPTTFFAKATGLHLLNVKVLRQLIEVGAESILFPTLLILCLWIFLCQRSGPLVVAGRGITAYLVPAGWVLGLSAFYYLKTASLESSGRYLLPLLPCEALLLGLFLASAESRLPAYGRWATTGTLVLHAVFALGLNYVIVMPVLGRFQNEYGATMQATAERLVELTANGANHRVLVKSDIGILSCEADGRFEIFDAGGLATPSLAGLDVVRQTQLIHPAFVVESLSASPEGIEAAYPGAFSMIWERRFQRHSIREVDLSYYTIIFKPRF